MNANKAEDAYAAFSLIFEYEKRTKKIFKQSIVFLKYIYLMKQSK